MTREEHTQVWDAAVSNTVKCVLECIDKEIQLAKDCQISTVILWRVRQDILELKGCEHEDSD